ncbi:MAG: adenylate/guanylate cyclase domain-containing protein, partial [Treponema porcinum]|nr:adenylate/guanylate cyclase domain-containing protein [Treponema porcinum]
RNNSRTRELCFLFTDIRGFTTLCEGRSPTDVINILDRYLGIETKIILANGGDVDKYVGDEMMAFFSGPDKEINACKAAMEIRKAMRKEQEKDQKEGTQPISMGIGINSGKVVFGPVGSSTRKDFTSIGDTVNLAARLEGANKEYGSKTIISEAVFEHLHNTFICRELDYITVKGKTEPVRIYEILQSAKLSTEKLYDIKKLFEAGLEAYRKKQWKTAEKYFTECNQKYDDAPSQVFLRRIIHYKISPPEKDWKGVFVMAVK